MKKIFTAACMLAVACTAQAQEDVLHILFNDGTRQSLRVADIKEMTFATDGEQPEYVLFKEFEGYILATSKYFTDAYYGDGARLGVYTAGEKYVVKVSDKTWGSGVFDDVVLGKELDGRGYMEMAEKGEPKRYEATIGGAMTSPVIDVPSVMGGLKLKFCIGKAPEAYAYAGKHTGVNSVTVGGNFTYTADITYDIEAAADGTLTLKVPEYRLADTVMGDLTLGAYTITGIAWDSDKKAFYRVYGADGLKEYFKAEKDGTVTMDKEYEFKDTSCVLIEKGADGIIITNSFSLGSMPFPIVAKFETAK